MKKTVMLSLFLCLICFTAESALPKLNKSATSSVIFNSPTSSNGSTVKNTDSTNTTSTVETSIKNTATQETGLATLPDGKAYVGVSTYLSLRDEPFGKVLAHLFNNEEVLIVNRDGDWYEIECDKGSGWIYGKCVFSSPNNNKTNIASNTAPVIEFDSTSSSYSNDKNGNYSYYVFKNPGQYTLNFVNSSKTTSSQKPKTSKKTTTKKTTQKATATEKTTKDTNKKANTSNVGSLQNKIVNAAKDLVKKYSKSGSFPYASGTNGGRLGCAQVATTVLKNAGALKKTSLGCKQTIELLKQAGWKKTKVPPYKAGDVIFWTTYKPGPSHVGIIMQSGNNVQAMSNSSSQRKPRYHSATYQKVYCVMRKA